MTVPCMAGKILIVDLTNGKIGEKPISDEMVQKYLGSRGIGAKILWDETDKNTEPLGSDNVLIFSAGTLTGTFAPSSGRVTVTFKSPTTNMYFKSTTGGHWGSKLKYAGYDILVLKGKSKKPAYIFIDDGKVSIKDADHLWGKDVRETTEKIREELEDQHIQVACIGPAGENKVLFSAIMFSTYHAAARGGGGAVMGSKNLKAVAVRGTSSIKVANPEKFKESAMRCRNLIMNDSRHPILSEFGTAGSVMGINLMGIIATRNFREGTFDVDKARYLTGRYLKEAGYLKGRVGCEGCVIGCHRYTEFKNGFSGGPEYETLASLGCGLCIDDTEAVLKGNELCNLYGLDTISTGGVIQWAVESFERGVLTEKDTDGIILNWSDSSVMLELIKKIAFREGIGDLLAEGTKIASERVGKDSYKWAIQARGLEQSRVDTRGTKSYALAFALNPRGPNHLHSQCIAEFGRSKEGTDRIKKITGSEKYATPNTTEKRPEIVQWHEDCYAATDALGFCTFATVSLYSSSPADMAEIFSYATGINMDEDKLMKAGERIVTLEQCYNIKLGKTREWHVLPWRLMNEKSPSEGGSTNTKEELDGMLDEYFELRKWDKRTSYPYLETLKSLNLEEIGDELNRMGIKL